MIVKNVGYIESYQANSGLDTPGIIGFLGGMAPISLFIFLSTKPSKKECKLPLLMYIVYNIVSLLGGKRYPFVAACMFLVIYYVIREKEGEKWIRKRYILISIILIPIFLIGLGMLDSIRLGKEITHIGMLEGIGNFFDQLGGSVNVIKREKYLENALQNVKFYSFDGLRSLLFENGIIRRIFDVPTYYGNSIEHAIYGHSLAHTLSYYTYKQGYLNGMGVGSSYIAELYHDFGYIGVLIGNIVYGYILKKISLINFTKPLQNAILFSMLNSLLLAPRSGFDNFLSNSFSIRNVVALISICLISKQYRKRGKFNENRFIINAESS